MKKYLLPSLKLTLLSLILLVGVYTMILLAIAKLAPGKGAGQTIVYKGRTYYTNIGQSFTTDRYFWSRPSAVNYDAAASGASNKGPTNPEFLQLVQTRIDTILLHNPGIRKSQIPVDMVTASGSGLDPNISEEGAQMQVMRIAKIRKIPEIKIQQLIQNNTERPFLGMMGPEKINVLKLNIALDELASQH